MDPYKVLGVSPSATDDEIKTAYRNLVKKYHPDRYANAPKEVQDQVSEKVKQINAAYDEIKRIRSGGGASSSTGTAVPPMEVPPMAAMAGRPTAGTATAAPPARRAGATPPPSSSRTSGR